MKVGLDTNILAYAEGTNGVEMKDKALDLLQRLPGGSVVLPTQVLGELFNVLVLKAKRPPSSARTAILGWRDAYPLSETSASVMVNAVDPATDHRLRIWDSVILSATAEAGCRLLLSEDLQEASRGGVLQPRTPSAQQGTRFLKCCSLSATPDEVLRGSHHAQRAPLPCANAAPQSPRIPDVVADHRAAHGQ